MLIYNKKTYFNLFKKKHINHKNLLSNCFNNSYYFVSKYIYYFAN